MTPGAYHQVVVISGVTLPLAAGAGNSGELFGIRVRPFQRLALLCGVGAQIFTNHRQVPQVIGALGVDLFGADLVTASAVQRGGGQQEHEREEQRLRGDESDPGGDQSDHHADDQDHDHDRHGAAQERRRNHPRQLWWCLHSHRGIGYRGRCYTPMGFENETAQRDSCA